MVLLLLVHQSELAQDLKVIELLLVEGMQPGPLLSAQIACHVESL